MFSQVVSGVEKTGRFVDDVRGFANIIRGNPIPEPRANDKGHVHEESSEFWMVLEGQIRYRIGKFGLSRAAVPVHAAADVGRGRKIAAASGKIPN